MMRVECVGELLDACQAMLSPALQACALRPPKSLVQVRRPLLLRSYGGVKVDTS